MYIYMFRDFIRALILQSMAKARILAQMQPDLRFYLFAVLSPGFGILYFLCLELAFILLAVKPYAVQSNFVELRFVGSIKINISFEW